jgi:hypothetical protein
MSAITWSKSTRVKASPDTVFAWMTDFQEDDHARHAFVVGSGAKKTYTKKPSKRTVVSRDGNKVKIHDEWGGRKFEMNLELFPLEREVKMTGPFGYQASWKAVPDEGQTKIEAHVELHMKGLMGFLAPLFRGRFIRELEQDFAGHIADLENDLAV